MKHPWTYLLPLLASCQGVEPGPEPPADISELPVTPSVASTLFGRVSFAGKAPEHRSVVVTPADLHCLKEPLSLPDRKLLVDRSGGVADAVVVIEVAGLDGAIEPRHPDRSPTLSYHLSGIEPRVVVVPAGGELLIENAEHDHQFNIHCYSRKNETVNRSLPPGSSADLSFDRPEAQVDIKCDIHPWLVSWVHVTDSPYWAVTDSEGRFTIEGIPPGEHRIRVRHPELKAEATRVQLDGGRTELDFTLEER